MSTIFLSIAMSIFNFKIRKIKVYYPFGKQLEKIIAVNASQPSEIYWIFSIIQNQKSEILVSIYDKQLNSKNDHKKPIRAFFRVFFFYPRKWKVPEKTVFGTFFGFFPGEIFFFSPTFLNLFSGSLTFSRALFFIFSRVDFFFSRAEI